MNTPSDPPHDPTMEEILASIRKIISDDQPGAVTPKGPPPRSDSAPADILDLTDEVPEDAAGLRPAVAAAPVKPVIAPAPAPERHDPLLSDASRQALGHAIDTVDKASVQYSAFAGGMLESVFARAVQDAVAPSLQNWVAEHQAELVEAAKPILREWVDANLPRLVETILRQELGRAITEHLRSRLG